MRGNLLDLLMGLDGRQRVTLALRGDWRADFDRLKDEEVDIEIKKHREKRSLDANAYMWALVGKIAEAMTPPLPKDDVYLEMLRRYGQSGMVSIAEKYVEQFEREFKYHDELGRSELNGKMFVHYRFYIGSSKYDSREMALLVDGVVSEAKALGIDTDTPEMIARIKEEWKA